MSGSEIAYFVGFVMVIIGFAKWFDCKALKLVWKIFDPYPFYEDSEDLYAACFWLRYGMLVLVGAFAYDLLQGLIPRPSVPQVENALLYIAIAAIGFAAIDMVRAQYGSPERQTGVNRAYVGGLRRIQVLLVATCALGFIMSLLGLSLEWSAGASIFIVVLLYLILRISK